MLTADEARHNIDVFRVSSEKLETLLVSVEKLIAEASEQGSCRVQTSVMYLTSAEVTRLIKSLNHYGYKVLGPHDNSISIYWDTPLK
jgi:hypothetical protein